jgi:hypothetical protein
VGGGSHACLRTTPAYPPAPARCSTQPARKHDRAAAPTCTSVLADSFDALPPLHTPLPPLHYLSTPSSLGPFPPSHLHIRIGRQLKQPIKDRVDMHHTRGSGHLGHVVHGLACRVPDAGVWVREGREHGREKLEGWGEREGWGGGWKGRVEGERKTGGRWIQIYSKRSISVTCGSIGPT